MGLFYFGNKNNRTPNANLREIHDKGTLSSHFEDIILPYYRLSQVQAYRPIEISPSGRFFCLRSHSEGLVFDKE